MTRYVFSALSIAILLLCMNLGVWLSLSEAEREALLATFFGDEPAKLASVPTLPISMTEPEQMTTPSLPIETQPEPKLPPELSETEDPQVIYDNFDLDELEVPVNYQKEYKLTAEEQQMLAQADLQTMQLIYENAQDGDMRSRYLLAKQSWFCGGYHSSIKQAQYIGDNAQEAAINASYGRGYRSFCQQVTPQVVEQFLQDNINQGDVRSAVALAALQYEYLAYSPKAEAEQASLLAQATDAETIVQLENQQAYHDQLLDWAIDNGSLDAVSEKYMLQSIRGLDIEQLEHKVDLTSAAAGFYVYQQYCQVAKGARSNFNKMVLSNLNENQIYQAQYLATDIQAQLSQADEIQIDIANCKPK